MTVTATATATPKRLAVAAALRRNGLELYANSPEGFRRVAQVAESAGFQEMADTLRHVAREEEAR